MAGRRLVAATIAAIAVAGMLSCGSRGRPPVVPSASPVPTSHPTTVAPTTTPSTAGPTTPPTQRLTQRPTPAPSGAGIPSALAGRDWERIPTSLRVVALTFDAGANADAVPSILATLARERVPATFFLTGRWVGRYPTLARRIGDAGYAIGDHSVDHPHFPALTDTEARLQVTAAAATIRAVAGVDPRPLFRFPYGERTAHDIALVNSLGFVPVRWTVDSLGWKGTSGGMTAQAVADRVLAAATPGEIVLMHVGSNPDDHTLLDADALPSVIARLRALGYRFTTLHTLTG